MISSMRPFLLLLTIGLGLAGPVRADETPRTSLSGRLLLPPGSGPRGLEIVATIDPGSGEMASHWLLFDEEGRFDEVLPGVVRRVAVSTGLHALLIERGPDALPPPDASGRIDLGSIDLRDRLVSHRMALRGSGWEHVRVALCFGPPPVGPQGGTVALGSRQFPERERDSFVEWLVPPEAEDLRFLVEFPADEGRGLQWRGGRQELFGPYRVAELPASLFLKE